MLNLFIPAGQTLQLQVPLGVTVQGYVTLRDGRSMQGKERLVQYNFAPPSAAAVTIATGDSTNGSVVTGWSLYHAAGGATSISVLVNGSPTGNTLNNFALGSRWTPQGIFNNTGQLVSSGANGLNAITATTSTTSLTIGFGSRAFTHSSATTLNWAVGSRVRVAVTASPTVNWMEGIVTSLTGTVTTINVDKTGGTGTFAAWTLTLSSEATVPNDVRTGVALTANGTTTINTTLNGGFTDHSIYTTQLTGAATENNLIDITNASAEKWYKIEVTRDGTAGTKTINFAGAGRTYYKDWTGTQAIGVNERWLFIVNAKSATEFYVASKKFA